MWRKVCTPSPPSLSPLQLLPPRKRPMTFVGEGREDRGAVIWGELLSAGAVATALHTVEDLLLQFLPLLLLLGQALWHRLASFAAVVEDPAVLGVPQVCI